MKDPGRDGRVGICTQGGAKGSHILLIREAVPGWWTLYVEPHQRGSTSIFTCRVMNNLRSSLAGGVSSGSLQKRAKLSRSESSAYEVTGEGRSGVARGGCDYFTDYLGVSRLADPSVAGSS